MAALATLAGTLAACSPAAVPPRFGPAAAAPSVPLTASAADSGGTWATVAMGHLSDPVNTFWQLLLLAAGSTGWTLVTPPGVASNGGLVASIGVSGTALVGFEPSLGLHFSPLAQSTNQGSVWTPGVLPGGLAATPDSLAAAGTGHPLALLDDGQVVSGDTGLATWTRVVSRAAVAAAPSTRACGVRDLTAVAQATAAGGGEVTLVGADCSRGGRAGVVELTGSGGGREVVTAIGPRLPGPTAAPTAVLRLVGTPDGVALLARVGTGGGARLVAAWSTDGLGTWTVSAPLPAAGAAVVSTGTTPSRGFVVVTAAGRAGRSAWVVEPSAGGSTVGSTVGSTAGWSSLTSPPSGTDAVAVTPAGGYDALVVDQAVLEVSTLTPAGWHRTQSLDVPIQYGSSS